MVSLLYILNVLGSKDQKMKMCILALTEFIVQCKNREVRTNTRRHDGACNGGMKDFGIVKK